MGKYLDSLRSRGIRLTSTPECKIRVFPPDSLSEKQRMIIRDNRAAILAELDADFIRASAEFDAQCEILEMACERGRIDADTRDAHMLRLARSCSVSYTDRDACECGETLFWRYGNGDETLPLMCYSCHTPPDGVVPVMFSLRDQN